MGSTITSTGMASGYDFDSIISAMVSSRRTSMNSALQTRQALKQSEISGVSQLKSALSRFESSLKALTEDNAFNARKITTSQTDYTCFGVTAEEDAANLECTVAVTQLAGTEKLKQKIAMESDEENSFSAGTLTFSLGTDDEGNEKSFSVEVEEGDTIELIRRKINQANDYGVSCNLVKSSSGYTLSIDGGVTGDDNNNLSITVDEAEGSTAAQSLSIFAFNLDEATEDGDGNLTAGSWDVTKAQDAKILVDGDEVSSSTNAFEDVVSGLTINVQKLSETETDSETGEESFKAYDVKVEEDYSKVTSKMSAFVSAYNSLQDTLTALTQRDTYSNGKSNYDGGYLAGDSMAQGIQNYLASFISSFTGSDSSGKTIYNMGIGYEDDGTLTFDSGDFTESLKENFNSVVNIFSGDEGLLTTMQNYVSDYTESRGILDQRTTELQSEVDEYQARLDRNDENLTKYEESLRARYAAVDSLIAGYNSSLSALTSVMSSIKASNSSK
ncbi:MAG: flagellar filament capping protein FliD [Succinivibrionaceae bacterium]|nr:flagellar filament capping protein FliD [Succinivibrionaceae bacterium]